MKQLRTHISPEQDNAQHVLQYYATYCNCVVLDDVGVAVIEDHDDAT